MTAMILSVYHELPNSKSPTLRRPLVPTPINKTIPWAFFDGVAQEHDCGGGFILHLNDQHYYNVKLGFGGVTNNFAELITLCHLLHFSLGHDCIFGDSKIIINWFNNVSACHAHTLRHILGVVILLKSQFNRISCHHIYREYNQSVDRLSKEASLLPKGQWLIQEQNGAEQYQYYHRSYIDQAYYTTNRP